MNETIAEVHAEIDAAGKGKITVNGNDVASSLVGFEVIAGFNQPTRLVLHEAASADLVVDGAVTVVKAQHTVLQFLDDVNPDDLESRSLNYGGIGVAEAFIKALKDIAREGADA